MSKQNPEVKALIEAAEEVCEWLEWNYKRYGNHAGFTDYNKLKSALEAVKKESGE